MAVVKNIPSTECGACMNCTTTSGEKYLITQNPVKEMHTLWRVLPNGFEKMTTSNDPRILQERIPWES